MNTHSESACHGPDHLARRTLLRAAGLSGLGWLTPMGDLLAQEAEASDSKWKPAKSVILLWLAGGPSQLETFDPHAGSKTAHGTKSIKTSVKGIELADTLPQLAEKMGDVSLVRSVVSKEGDHERAFYNMKTGYRPNPSIVHPSMGAILAHELPTPKVEIPTHISILPNQWPGRGGFLGAQFDAFQIYDPQQRLPDMSTRVQDDREQRRNKGLSVVEQAFAKGRDQQLLAEKTLHNETITKARQMMTSDQLKAFDVAEESQSLRENYGDTPFGRGCLAARRLIEVGVRCVEVTLQGFDSHINNHEAHTGLMKTLDPAFSALIADLKERGLLESTVVLCGGEFGRTPKLNGLEGRDHWPNGFSVAIAGGGIRGGRVVGETDPDGEAEKPDKPVGVEDIHATIQTALGLNPEKELMSPVGRPMSLSHNGFEIEELL
ncbi:MAG: hypothetical protein ACI8UO_000727 [Verrucomicrobiales bacterium]|jgi:uncharacterized protein (DUF1501 family)